MYGNLDDYRELHLLSAPIIRVNGREYAIVCLTRKPDSDARRIADAQGTTYYAAASTMSYSTGTGRDSLPEFYQFITEAISKLGLDSDRFDTEFVTHSIIGFDVVYETRIIPKAEWMGINDFWTADRARRASQARPG